MVLLNRRSTIRYVGFLNTLCCCARLCRPPPARLQVCSRVFGASSGLVDMLVQHIPSSKVATANKVARLYTGPQDPSSPLLQFMNSCSRSGVDWGGAGEGGSNRLGS